MATALKPSTAGYDTVGLPSWEEVEEDLAPSAMSAEDDVKPNPKSMGDGDVESIIYINLEKDIPPAVKGRLRELEGAIKLSNQWLSVKAGWLTEVKMRAKELPDGDGIDDQLKRASYRAKVVDDYMTRRTNWMYPYAVDIRKYGISVKKSELHLKLLQVAIQGITVPSSVHEKLEKILQSISDGIKTASKDQARKQMYWILLSVYKYDDRQDAVIPTLRSIYFTVSQEIREYSVYKYKYEDANFEFGFAQRDFQFTEPIWKALEGETIKYLSEQGVKIIRDTPDVPVD